MQPNLGPKVCSCNDKALGMNESAATILGYLCCNNDARTTGDDGDDNANVVGEVKHEMKSDKGTGGCTTEKNGGRTEEEGGGTLEKDGTTKECGKGSTDLGLGKEN
ncbi:S-layer-like proteiny domain-containing protein [Sesbania bispinosa]|nr:S-layer-like proteiny domain-containing protein [Sesbania bispinosa]